MSTTLQYAVHPELVEGLNDVIPFLSLRGSVLSRRSLEAKPDATAAIYFSFYSLPFLLKGEGMGGGLH